MKIPQPLIRLHRRLKKSRYWRHRWPIISTAPFLIAVLIGGGIHYWRLKAHADANAAVNAQYDAIKKTWDSHGESTAHDRFQSTSIPTAQDFHQHPAFLAELNKKHALTLDTIDQIAISGLSNDSDVYEADHVIGKKIDIKEWLDPKKPSLTTEQAAQHCLDLLQPLKQRLDAIKDASTRPHITVPDPIAAYDIVTVAHRVESNAANLLSKRAMLHLTLGNPSAALSDLSAIHRMLVHTRSHASILGLVLTEFFRVEWANAVAYGLTENKWTEQELALIAKQCGQLSAEHHMMRSIQGEVIFALNETRKILDDPDEMSRSDLAFKTPKEWNWQGLKAYYNKQHAACASTANILSEYLTELDSLTHNVIFAHGVKQQAFTPKIMSSFVSPSTPSGSHRVIFESLALRYSENQNLQVAIAAQRYHLQHQQYPKNLAQLVPNFLPTVPQDYFTATPLHYLKKPDGSILIYSNGEDLTDNSGDPNDDICFPLSHPTP